MKCCAVCPAGALECVSRETSAAEILSEVVKDRAFYGEEGGMTLSGGEPLFHGEKTLRLIESAKSKGIKVAVETCGYFDEKYLPRLVASTDIFLWDVKDTDPERHKANTGADNALILKICIKRTNSAERSYFAV